MSENQIHNILYIQNAYDSEIVAKSAMCRIYKSELIAYNRESSTCIHLFEHLYIPATCWSNDQNLQKLQNLQQSEMTRKLLVEHLQRLNRTRNEPKLKI